MPLHFALRILYLSVRIVGRLDKEQPAAGGWLASKPTWRSALGQSATSAFFCVRWVIARMCGAPDFMTPQSDQIEYDATDCDSGRTFSEAEHVAAVGSRPIEIWRRRRILSRAS